MKTRIKPSSFFSKEDIIEYLTINRFGFLNRSKLDNERASVSLIQIIEIYNWLEQNIIPDDWSEILESTDWWRDLLRRSVDIHDITIACELFGFKYEVEERKDWILGTKFKLFGKIRFHKFNEFSNRHSKVLPLTYRAELEGGSYDF